MADDEHISFDQFGHSFMREVVTADRVAATIASVVGDQIEVGPLAAGPGHAARASLRGKLAGVDASPTGEDGESLRFSAVVRLDCTLAVKAPALNKRYRGSVTIPLRLVVRTASPLRLVIDVEPPSPPDIGVELESGDRSGRFIQVLGNIDDEVRTRAAAEVAERVDAPEARRHREIDILAMVDDVWQP
ncbi:MAG: hypothetical protein JO086_08520 [Acidimicrobiia bacterium]|nr:hypothetical protein [Acidimicrobiia bacterium]